MELPLAEKPALVTGTSGGVGSAVAKRLAEDGASGLVHHNSSRDEAEAVVREAARRMTAAGWGRIINRGSIFGKGVCAPGLSTYCGTKSAVQGLTRGWSRDLGPRRA